MTLTSTIFKRKRARAKMKKRSSKILLGTISLKMRTKMTMMAMELLLTSSLRRRMGDASQLSPSVDVSLANMRCLKNLMLSLKSQLDFLEPSHSHKCAERLKKRVSMDSYLTMASSP
jgi:hypothetical protein